MNKIKKVLKALIKTLIVLLIVSVFVIVTMFFPYIAGTIIFLIGIVIIFTNFYSEEE